MEDLLGPQEPPVDMQLKNTERAYDRSLQENLDLVEELRTLQSAYNDLFEINMHLTRKTEHFERLNAQLGQKIDAMRQEHIHLSGNERVERRTVGEISETKIEPVEVAEGRHDVGYTKPIDDDDEPEEDYYDAIAKARTKAEEEAIPGSVVMGVAAHDAKVGEPVAVKTHDTIILDDPLNAQPEDYQPGGRLYRAASPFPQQETDYDAATAIREWYESTLPPKRPAPQYSAASAPRVIEALWDINADLRRRRKEQEGLRAKMKISLDQSQKANARYKSRIERLEEDVEKGLTMIETLAPIASRFLAIVAAVPAPGERSSAEVDLKTRMVTPADRAMAIEGFKVLEELEQS